MADPKGGHSILREQLEFSRYVFWRIQATLEFSMMEETMLSGNQRTWVPILAITTQKTSCGIYLHQGFTSFMWEL